MKFWHKVQKKYLIVLGVLFLCVFLVLPSLMPVFGEDSVLDLRRQIDVKKRDIQSLDEEQEKLKKEIEQKEQEAKTLANQLAILENSIKQAEVQVEKTEKEIEKTALEINTVETQIQEIGGEIQEQKKILARTVRLLYQYDQVDLLEILFTYDSLADFFDQVANLEKLQNKGKETLDKIKQIKQELEANQANLKKQKEALDQLKIKLDEQKAQLAFEKEGKERLLRETQMQEEKYQELLVQARAEQEAANVEIQQLEQEIQKKLYEERPDTWRDIGGKTDLSWPIMPYEGISAYFMDPTYRAAFGIDHYAIDLPTPQGTPIHAPADGIVVKNRDAGYGYSYVMVYHGNNTSTVYGHVSGFAAAEGQEVKKGEVIGYTGGTPGTRGAGWLTTGPHLHFEVRISGTPVDPLKYLPKTNL
jgi:murein DD-endopeptidase MepM/ murein hydrolase activator NlpD